MTKAALCVSCSDIVAPYRHWRTDRRWRWCECMLTGVRWRDGDQGLLEVTSVSGRAGVRVLGLSNTFLTEAVGRPPADAQGWRALHQTCTDFVEPHYLFHEKQRCCWALIVRPGESGDVTFIDFAVATADT